MKHEFPAAVPEIPVNDMSEALNYHEGKLGFNIDWGGADGGIAGISKGQCRMFLTDRGFREEHGNVAPVVIWLNLWSKKEVDALYQIWNASKAKIISPPESKPWELHEFTAWTWTVIYSVFFMIFPETPKRSKTFFLLSCPACSAGISPPTV